MPCFFFLNLEASFLMWRLNIVKPPALQRRLLGSDYCWMCIGKKECDSCIIPKPVLVPWWTVALLPGATVCTSHHWNICLMCLKRGVSGQTSAFLSTAFHYAKVIWNSGDSSGPSGSATFPIDLIHCWSQIEIHRVTPAPWNFQQRQINRDRKSPSGDRGFMWMGEQTLTRVWQCSKDG